MAVWDKPEKEPWEKGSDFSHPQDPDPENPYFTSGNFPANTAITTWGPPALTYNLWTVVNALNQAGRPWEAYEEGTDEYINLIAGDTEAERILESFNWHKPEGIYRWGHAGLDGYHSGSMVHYGDLLQKIKGHLRFSVSMIVVFLVGAGLIALLLGLAS